MIKDTMRHHVEAIKELALQTDYFYEPPLEFLTDITTHANAVLKIIDSDFTNLVNEEIMERFNRMFAAKEDGE